MRSRQQPLRDVDHFALVLRAEIRWLHQKGERDELFAAVGRALKIVDGNHGFEFLARCDGGRL